MRKFQSSSYQHWPQAAGQVHALPCQRSRCSPKLEWSYKKSIKMKLSHILRPAQETSHHSLLVLSVVVTAHFGNLRPAWHPVPRSQLLRFETQPTSCENQCPWTTYGWIETRIKWLIFHCSPIRSSVILSKTKIWHLMRSSLAKMGSSQASSLSMLLIIWRHNRTGYFVLQPTQSWGRTWSFDPWRRCWACQDSCAKSCSHP